MAGLVTVTMDVSITLENQDMRDAFLEGLNNTGHISN